MRTTPMPPEVVRGWIGIVVSGAPRETHIEGNELMMRFLSYPEIASVDPRVRALSFMSGTTNGRLASSRM